MLVQMGFLTCNLIIRNFMKFWIIMHYLTLIISNVFYEYDDAAIHFRCGDIMGSVNLPSFHCIQKVALSSSHIDWGISKDAQLRGKDAPG